jgi:hypothetical protein
MVKRRRLNLICSTVSGIRGIARVRVLRMEVIVGLALARCRRDPQEDFWKVEIIIFNLVYLQRSKAQNSSLGSRAARVQD